MTSQAQILKNAISPKARNIFGKKLQTYSGSFNAPPPQEMVGLHCIRVSPAASVANHSVHRGCLRLLPPQPPSAQSVADWRHWSIWPPSAQSVADWRHWLVWPPSQSSLLECRCLLTVLGLPSSQQSVLSRLSRALSQSSGEGGGEDWKM